MKPVAAKQRTCFHRNLACFRRSPVAQSKLGKTARKLSTLSKTAGWQPMPAKSEKVRAEKALCLPCAKRKRISYFRPGTIPCFSGVAANSCSLQAEMLSHCSDWHEAKGSCCNRLDRLLACTHQKGNAHAKGCGGASAPWDNLRKTSKKT